MLGLISRLGSIHGAWPLNAWRVCLYTCPCARVCVCVCLCVYGLACGRMHAVPCVPNQPRHAAIAIIRTMQ